MNLKTRRMYCILTWNECPKTFGYTAVRFQTLRVRQCPKGMKKEKVIVLLLFL